MNKIKRIIPFLVTILLFSTLAPASASAKKNKISEIEQKMDNEMFEQTAIILEAIEKIPQNMLDQGPQATADWFKEKTGLYVTADSKGYLHFSEIDPTAIMPMGALACASAIGVAIVSNVFSITKITKIKYAIKALGGTTKAVKDIKKWYDKYRQGGFSRTKSIEKAMDKVSSGLGQDVKAALLDFLSLTAVTAACFED